MTAEFLSGAALSTRIIDVMAGQNPRMSVAFLGPDWVKHLFGVSMPSDLKVICDLGMGGTVRSALVAGGAPENDKLCHLPNSDMHGKVYLSQKGAVVCSVNASQRGLISRQRIEDGIWIGPQSKAYAQVEKMFTERFAKAEMVLQHDMDKVPEKLNFSRGSCDLRPRRTIVEALRLNPDAFHGVRFVCFTTLVEEEMCDAADALIDEDHIFSNIKSRDYFSDWNIKESKWPSLFFSVYCGSQGGFALQKQRHIMKLDGVVPQGGGDAEDIFISQKIDWRISGAAFNDFPSFATRPECETELQSLMKERDLFGKCAGKIFTAKEFSNLLFDA